MGKIPLFVWAISCHGASDKVGISPLRAELHSALVRDWREKSTVRTGVACGGMEIPAYLCD